MIRNGIYMLLFAIITSCTSSKVFYDYDTKTNFSKYDTYHFFEDVGEGLSELDVKRFTASIENILDSLPLKKIYNPSFFINVISDKNKSTQDNIDVGIGSGGRNLGVGFSTGISVGGSKLEEYITIDFVDASTNKLFWQGVMRVKYNENIRPKERDILVGNIVREILAKYPPK
jgi:hypothetical protein